MQHYSHHNDQAISGDDRNRHYREAKLGFKAPSDDWADCHLPVVCIFPDQYYTTQAPSYHHNFKMIVINGFSHKFKLGAII